MRRLLNKNVLSNIFNFLGDALEDFNPAAFRFLSAVLPYATPIPVAWLTADSASEFLNFTPEVSFIFVFCLEGIGLWFTSLLVDAVVEWVRSRNGKAFFPVFLFLIGVGSYIYLLINLNVLLEQATGSASPIHSRVVTLLCFLPLITGIGNGYGKLKLEQKTNTEKEKLHQEEVDLRLEREREERKLIMFRETNALQLQKEQLQARKELEMEKFRQKEAERQQKEMERQRKEEERQQKLSESLQNVPKRPNSLSETFRNFPKDWRSAETEMTPEQLSYIAHLNPQQVREVAAVVGVTEKTITNWRTSAKIKLGE